MKNYIYSLTFLLVINASAEELKYECECRYAEVYVKDPIQNIEETTDDPNCEISNEGNAENTVFLINLDDGYIYDAKNKGLKSKLEKINDSEYVAYITNEQFKEIIETMTNDESNSEEMSDFAKGMIEVLGGMFEFATLEQKSSFEILVDERIQKEDELFLEMDFAEMFKGLDIPINDELTSSGNFITNVSSFSMCTLID
tara:strand:- start:105 stop:704 length:600 start_codon:yes stop_codon:yes gene_type:complete